MQASTFLNRTRERLLTGHRTVRVGIKSTVAILALALVATACSGDTSAGDGTEPDNGDPQGESPAAVLAALYEELEGLDGDARRERLVELALEEVEESGLVTLYASTPQETTDPVLEELNDTFGVAVASYRASIDSIVARINQEQSAGRPAWDVTMVRGPYCALFEEDDMLLELNTPLREDYDPNFGSDYWLPPYVTPRIPVWNDELVTGDRVPATWEDVLNNFTGTLILDDRQWGWFAAIVPWLMEEYDLSEDEVVQWFHDAEPTIVQGSFLTSELLGAGEHEIAGVVGFHTLPDPTVVPVAWEPIVEPVVVEPYCVAMSSSSQRVASALLLTEYILDTEGQQFILDDSRVSANLTMPGGSTFEGLEIVDADPGAIVEEADHWIEQYRRVFE